MKRFKALAAAAALLSCPTLAYSRPPDVSDADRRSEHGDPRSEVRHRDPEVEPLRDSMSRHMEIASREALRWSEKMPGARLAHAADEGWVSLGPTDAKFQWNGSTYAQVDSGRPTSIAVDPRDPNVVYVATSGGGIWKTYNFVTGYPNPDWNPITENVGNLAIGAMALDPSNPDTIYVGFGDAFDVSGHAIIKSTDGGGSWSAPVFLTSAYPASSGGLKVQALSVRDLRVDPTDAHVVLAATDVGLFRSMDAGASFTHIDLPNSAAMQVGEAMWSIVYLGGSGGASAWLASGIGACAPSWLPPWPGAAVPAGATSFMHIDPAGEPCQLGNVGEVWRSTDGGNSWTSVRSALPSQNTGRMHLATGNPVSPDGTAVYAMVENSDESSSETLAIWRSLDGGKTWKNATGVLGNPTQSGDCGDLNIGHDQTWYNTAIAVDPNDNDNVIIGGNLCGARTTNGTAPMPRWDNISHWLPSSGQGDTSDGTLPYVHADWHVALVSNTGGTTRVFAGTDGGIFSSADVFTALSGTDTTWGFHNRGIVTHLSYAVGSGDPANGDPFLVFTGMQDNGTRYRDSTTAPTVFNQIIGGDGSGCAANKGTAGEFLWAAVYGNETHIYCRGDISNCNSPDNWNSSDPAIGGMESFPFVTRYAVMQTDPTGATFVTISSQGVWKSNASFSWTRVGAAFPSSVTVRNISVSPTKPEVYAAGLSGGHVAVSNGGVNWVTSAATIGGNGTTVKSTASVALQPNPPAGKETETYVVASVAESLDDKSPVPDALGHLYLTTDKGNSFKPIHGNGTGQDLPNVPISVVRFDPTDMTNQTLYVGTDLGVYRSIDLGQTWQRFGYGLPMVKVTDMFIAKNRSLIRIATFGRGIWEVYPTSGTAKGVDGNGDFDQNTRIDWADLAAMASRVGTNPSTATWPTYVWIDDMTSAGANPPVNLIDDNDLSQLLAVFGEHP